MRGGTRDQRRVVVKARFVRIKASDTGAIRAHLATCGATVPRARVNQASLRRARRADGKGLHRRLGSDRHQSRFIVAPEDGVELYDLKPLIRDFMRDGTGPRREA